MEYYCPQCKLVLSEQQVERLGTGMMHRVIIKDRKDRLHPVRTLDKED